MPSRHLKGSRPFHRTHRRQRGSLVVSVCFLVTLLLLVATSRTIQSLSAVQLGRHFADSRNYAHVAEAGLDEALWHLRNEPTFGNTADSNLRCAADSTWDCWPTSDTTTLPGLLTPYVLQAQDIALIRDTGFERTTRKRLRVTATTQRGEVTAYEMLVDVTQSNSYSARAGSRIELVNGTASKRTRLYAPEIAAYAGAILPGNRAPIRVLGTSLLQGAVLVKAPPSNPRPPDSMLCCDAGAGGTPPDYITVGFGSVTARGSIIAELDPTHPVLANSTGLTAAALGPPAHAERPRFTTGNFSPEPVVAKSATCSPGGNVSLGPSTTYTFCRAGSSNPSCNETTGTVLADGSVEYCFDSLVVGSSTNAKFEGNSVNVYFKNYSSYSGTRYAIRTRPSSVIYSFKSTGPADLTNLGSLTLNVHDGPNASSVVVGIMGTTDLYASVNAPRSEIRFGTDAIVNVPNGGYFIGNVIIVQGDARVTIPSLVTPPSNTIKAVQVVGWRRCGNPTCTE